MQKVADLDALRAHVAELKALIRFEDLAGWDDAAAAKLRRRCEAAQLEIDLAVQLDLQLSPLGALKRSPYRVRRAAGRAQLAAARLSRARQCAPYMAAAARRAKRSRPERDYRMFVVPALEAEQARRAAADADYLAGLRRLRGLA